MLVLQLVMLNATITLLKERTDHEESMPFLLESVRKLVPFAHHQGTPLTLWIALLAHLTTTLPNSPQIGDISCHGSPQGGGAGRQYGQGSPNQGSGSRGRPYLGSRGGGGRFKFYYHKSMVEDPWKALKPVIWKPRGDTRDCLKSWLPNSVSTKKAKLGETPTKSTLQQSLA